MLTTTPTTPTAGIGPIAPVADDTAAQQHTLHQLQKWLDELPDTLRQAADRRAAPRQAVHGPIRLGLYAPGQERFVTLHQGWATDLSMLGMGLLLERPLERNVELLVDLERVVQRPCVLDLRIVYCQKLLRQTHRLGGVFPCFSAPIAVPGCENQPPAPRE